MVWLLDESGLFVRLPIRTDRQTAPHTDRGVAVRSVMSAAPGNGRSLPIRERERGGWSQWEKCKKTVGRKERGEERRCNCRNCEVVYPV